MGAEGRGEAEAGTGSAKQRRGGQRRRRVNGRGGGGRRVLARCLAAAARLWRRQAEKHGARSPRAGMAGWRRADADAGCGLRSSSSKRKHGDFARLTSARGPGESAGANAFPVRRTGAMRLRRARAAARLWVLVSSRARRGLALGACNVDGGVAVSVRARGPASRSKQASTPGTRADESRQAGRAYRSKATRYGTSSVAAAAGPGPGSGSAGFASADTLGQPAQVAAVSRYAVARALQVQRPGRRYPGRHEAPRARASLGTLAWDLLAWEPGPPGLAGASK